MGPKNGKVNVARKFYNSQVKQSAPVPYLSMAFLSVSVRFGIRQDRAHSQ